MICILRSVTFDGTTVYQGQVQMDVHDDVPIFEGALCRAGFAKLDIDEALTHAHDGLRRLQKANRVRPFPPCNAPIGVLRGDPPGRLVYLPIVRVAVHAWVPVFQQTSIGQFPEDIDMAISLAQNHG